MAYEQRDLSGSLFRNRDKQADKHPDYGGSALIDGIEYWVNGWIKEGAKGKWMSLAFKPKVERRRESPPIEEDLDDKVPF